MHRPLVLAGLTALAACAGPRPATVDATVVPHLGEAWLPFRAAQLGIVVEAAAARDAALPLDAPPDDAVFDRALAIEAAALWRDVCAPCHGLLGKRDGTAPQPDPQPKVWGTFGTRMGFLFGGDKMRAGIYRSVAEGETDPTGRVTMPPWGSVLSREQIWGLVRHIEGL